MITRELKANTPTQVKSDKIGVQVVGENPNCTVEYSVTGDVWTAHQTKLTEVNNVICSIPRSMYLRFDTDIILTEE